jgi:hypothetical protein
LNIEVLDTATKIRPQQLAHPSARHLLYGRCAFEHTRQRPFKGPGAGGTGVVGRGHWVRRGILQG